MSSMPESPVPPELGYVERQSISLEHRWGGGRIETLPDLAVDRVRVKVDVLSRLSASVINGLSLIARLPDNKTHHKTPDAQGGGMASARSVVAVTTKHRCRGLATCGCGSSI